MKEFEHLLSRVSFKEFYQDKQKMRTVGQDRKAKLLVVQEMTEEWITQCLKTQRNLIVTKESFKTSSKEKKGKLQIKTLAPVPSL